MARENSLVGSPVERVEDERLLRGRGQFVDDLARPGCLHAVILRSQVAHGRLRGIETSAALALPGVHAVLTAADIGNAVPHIPLRLTPIPEGEPLRQPVIAAGRVRYVGEPLAIVLAESPAAAEDALEAIAVDIEPLPAVVDAAAARAGKHLLFDGRDSNIATVFLARKGDCEAAFRSAPYVRRERFSVQRHTALPMEPRGLLAEWDAAAGRLTVWGAAKVPFFNRNTLATMLGMPAAAVDLMEVDVGGGFGARGEFYPEDFLVPFAARRLGRPVRWTEDRREHLIAMNHARQMSADLEIACNRDGTVIGIRGNIDVDTGAYVRTNGFTPPRNVAQFVTGPYRVPNVGIDATVLLTNKTPCGTYRGPGRYEASFYCERLLDLAAGDLGIDRVEMRRRNLVSAAEMPYPFARMGHADNMTETECDGGEYAAVLDRCLELFGWQERARLDGRQVDGRYHGIAIGCFVEGGATGPRENARMTLEADGSVTLDVGSSAIGQGIETIMAQIAGDALELPMSRIRVRHGSTTLVKEGFGSFHSRSTVLGGNAVVITAHALLDEVRTRAAARLGCAVEDVQVSEGDVTGPGGQRLGLEAFGGEGIAVERSFANTKLTYSYGAHAAHISVDAGTGHVEVVDYVTTEDVGRIVNPLTLHGQVIGAVVQGFGSTFLEELSYDAEGNPLVGTLADYLLPTASDYRVIRSESMQIVPCPNNPLGVKGAGEGGLIAVGGVIANAIASALRDLRVEPRDLPLSPQRMWQLIASARRQ